jgi:hypothetical protein
MKDPLGKILRIVAIIFMGLTGAMNLLGGIGTVCAAFLTKQFPPMWVFLDYQLLYQSLMIVTILIGLGGIWATIRLVRGGENVYRNALILLLVGTVIAAVQYFASLSIRGKAAPANVKFYINALTLLYVLILRLPGIRERVDFDRSTDDGAGQLAGGMTAIIIGIVVISTSLWVGDSHVYEGVNWTYVLREFLTGSGLACMAMGVIALLAPAVRSRHLRKSAQTG